MSAFSGGVYHGTKIRLTKGKKSDIETVW